jgi:hypothetical protein
MNAFWGQALAPFMALLFLTIARPFRRLVERKMRDGKLKRLLLLRIGADQV